MQAAPPAVTAFRAFPGVPANPTETVLAHLASQPGLLPSGTRTALLDVDYRTVGPALDALLAARPSALVLMGYSHLARGITLERRATGLCAPDKPDVRGHVAATSSDAPCISPLDLTALARRLSRHAPCEVSQDAGQYLCNFSYRHALLRVRALDLPTRVVFVHMPALADTPLAASSALALSLESTAAALAELVAELSGAYSPPE